MIRPLERQETLATPPLVGQSPHCRYAWRCIHNAAAAISRRRGFSPADREDLAQDLALSLCEDWAQFDPDRGTIESFISTLVTRLSASLVRKRYAKKRGFHFERHPLPWEDERSGEPWLGFREHAEFRIDGKCAHAMVDLRHDVAVVLQKLPTRLRPLAELLQRYSVREIAFARGKSTERIYKDKKKLRCFFAKLVQDL